MANARYYVTAPVLDAGSVRAGSMRIDSMTIEELYSMVLSDAVSRHRRLCGYDAALCAGWYAQGDARGGQAGVDEAPAGGAASGEAAAGETATGDAKSGDARSGDARSGDARAPAARASTALAELAQLYDIHYTHTDSMLSGRHALAAQSLLRRTLRHSHRAIYKAAYEGRYCARDRVDVSASAAPAKCAHCGEEAELIREERYFFRLSAFADRLLALYQYRPAFVLPRPRRQEACQLVHGGLADIAISSRAGFGIPWPEDPQQSIGSGYAAPAMYLSAIGFAGGGALGEEFERYWPANWHVGGPQALRLHAIEWPAFLMAADLKMPRHTFTHGSVSLEPEPDGSLPAPQQILRTLGSDAFRYGLLRGVGYGQDARLSLSGLVARNNAELSGELGSLARRIGALAGRFTDGKLPRRSLLAGLDWTLEIASRELLADARFLFDNLNFSEGLEKIRSLVALIGSTLEASHADEWSSNASRRQELTDWLYDACESLGLATLFLYPAIPRASAALWKSLGQSTLPDEQLVDLTPWGFLRPGTRIADPGDLFPLLEPSAAPHG